VRITSILNCQRFPDGYGLFVLKAIDVWDQRGGQMIESNELKSEPDQVDSLFSYDAILLEWDLKSTLMRECIERLLDFRVLLSKQQCSVLEVL